ncbi:MAG: histidine kinase [Burkholderiaceae bacterium]|nr:histidine kinase [Burkholderiaceae bacterium]
MRDSQILSTFQDLPAPAPGLMPRALVFDACRVGVVLRAVLCVEAVVAVAAMFGAGGLADWLLRLALVTAGALPAVLSWLLAACSLKRVLARLPGVAQYLAGVILGVLAGLYGCGLLALAGLLQPAPWLASASFGALFAAMMVWALVLRSRSAAPADTAARLSELQSRIRPHFLFNTLNSAIALVRESPAQAEALLEDLSDLFRHALADTGAPVRLAQEIELAARYLAIEQVRFGDRLRLEWDLDPAAADAHLPALLLQPLVENAVRHGAEPDPQGARVRIATERRGDRVLIKISNTVPSGPVPANGQGHGMALANVRDRLLLLHDVQGRFQAGMKDGLYQVRIEIPAAAAA